ncbi:MAG: hypothetical protein ACOC7V_08450 [Spirochaetota bacterium]
MPSRRHASKTAPREWYIGWSAGKREENLKLAVKDICLYPLHKEFKHLLS